MRPISLDVFLFHLGLAIVMFLVVNWLGKRSIAIGYIHISVFAQEDPAPAFNFIFRVLSPVVFLLLVSVALYATHLDRFVGNIFLVVFYYFGIRLLFNALTERWGLLNWMSLGPQIIVTVALSLLSYSYLIQKRNILLPNLDTIGNQVWLAIAVFLYALLNRVRIPQAGTERRKRSYLRHRYTKFQSRYGSVVRKHTSNSKLEALVFAVMILETFNRPKAYRLIERVLFPIGWVKSLGIMQVRATENISDLESVNLGAAKIISDHAKALAELKIRLEEDRLRGRQDIIWKVSDLEEGKARYLEHRVIHETLVKYNYSGDYAREIEELHEIILKEFYPDCKGSLLGDLLSQIQPIKKT
jgi:hypothetical protein